ncbi:neurotensin receptor type 1-like [Argonauta hians]
MELKNYNEAEAYTNFTNQFTSEAPIDYDDPPHRSIESLIIGVLRSYVNPLISTVGIIGNLISIWVFSAKGLRRLSSSVYVQAVLVSDTFFLITILAVWLESFNYMALHFDGICQGNVYLSYVSSFLSVWYVVCITIENYITICHPLKLKTVCTFKRARITTVVFAFAGLITFLVIIPITKPQKHINPTNNASAELMCETVVEYKNLMNILTYMDTVISILIPMIAIVGLTSMIIVETIRSVHKKQIRSANKDTQFKKLSDVPQVRVARLLFAISFTFLILNLPSYCARLIYIFVPDIFPHYSITSFTVYQCLLHISYSSFALKFFILYTFSGNFRKVLFKKLFCGFTQTNAENRTTERIKLNTMAFEVSHS